MPDGIPPWMNVNPLAPVPFYAQGFSQGAQIGESRRRAEQVAYEQELQQQAQQERNEILREARQVQAQEFAQELKLKQETASAAARQAALQLEGRMGLERGMQTRIGQGMTPEEAFRQELPLHATKLLSGREQSLAQILETMRTRQAQYGTPTTVSLGGQEFAHVPGSATLSQIRQTGVPGGEVEAVRIINPDTGEVTYGRPSTGGNVIPLPRGENRVAASRQLRKELADLGKEKKQAELLPAMNRSVVEIDADIQSARAQLDALSPTAKPRPESPIEQATGGTILPLPSKKEELIKGRIYNTPRGVALWDGEKFTRQ